MTRPAPRWTVAFLRALERTGKVRWAAEDAGIDFTTAYARRQAHPEFAAEWAAAKARGDEERDRVRGEEMAGAVKKLRRRASKGPSPGSPAASPTSPARGGGEEHVIVNGRLTRVGPGRWSKAKERALLEELALTGSVRLACRKVGLSRQAVSRRRGNDRHLDDACAAAIEIGRGNLDAWLVDAGNQTFDPDELPVADGLPKVTVAEAIQIVKLGGPRRAAAAQPEVERYDVAEVHARLQRKMELLGRHGRGEEARPGA